MCGATHSRNSQGLEKDSIIVFNNYVQLVLYIAWLHNSMMFFCMVLRRIVRVIITSLVPEENKL